MLIILITLEGNKNVCVSGVLRCVGGWGWWRIFNPQKCFSAILNACILQINGRRGGGANPTLVTTPKR